MDPERAGVVASVEAGSLTRAGDPPRVYHLEGGRPAKHGGEFVFGDPAT
ncbi:hypothetical protein [Couchioplanes caeruleus]|nr:hypothetical protein [Couchioplanes caeruleus]